MERKSKGFSRELFEWFETAAVAIVLVVCVFTFVCRIVMVEGSSMNPTLVGGQRVIVSELFYKPKAGDVVIACVPGKSDPYVKRIIATEGQVVDYDPESLRLTIDGVKIDEPYINEQMTRTDWYDPNIYPVTVGEGQVFICGDNRNHSNDSRYASIGPVDEENIMGKVIFIVTPFKQAGRVK